MVEAMEIQKGFQKTEVGIIPSDWDFDEIQNLADITTGAKNTQDRVPDGDYPFFVRSQTIERINSYSFVGEAVLTAGDGVGTGKVFHYINGKFDFHQRVYKISNFSERLDGYFFYLYFSKNFYNRIMQMTAKSSVDSVRREMIAKMLIPVPREAEQTAIATALNYADALIALLEKLIAKKRNIKQGTMQELLKPKEGWEVKKLGELISFVVDNRGKTPPLSKEGKPLIEVNAIYKQGKSPNYNLVSKFVNQITYERWFRDGHPKKGNILIVTVGSAGLTSYIQDEIGCIAQNIIAIRIKRKFSSEFVYYYTLTRLFTEQVSSVLMGAVQPSLKVPHLESFTIAIPSDRMEQTRIARILSDMDTEMEALEKKLEKYKMIKQGMMQNLLTGRIRLV